MNFAKLENQIIAIVIFMNFEKVVHDGLDLITLSK